MPITSSRGGSEPGQRSGDAVTSNENPLVDNEQQRELVVRAQPVKQPSKGNDFPVKAGSHTSTESLILAQDERWRRA